MAFSESFRLDALIAVQKLTWSHTDQCQVDGENVTLTEMVVKTHISLLGNLILCGIVNYNRTLFFLHSNIHIYQNPKPHADNGYTAEAKAKRSYSH